MPHTRSAPGEEVGGRAFAPPLEHVEAAAESYALMDQAHWSFHQLDSITFHESFEATCSETRALIGPLTGYAGKYGDAVRQLAQRAYSSGKIDTDTAVARGRTKTAAAMRVLVVEDDAVIGALLADMLAAMGHDVCGIEATEADAVSAAARYKPDLMIVDVGLGDGSGISAIETIHRKGPVPHVFVSGDVSSVRTLRPSSIFMQKPYRESDLARVIQQALDAASIQ